MTYQLRPDASGDTLVATRNPIRNNFEIIQNRFQDNHTDFDSGTGKHKFMQMPEQAAAPTTAANEGGLYTKQGSYSAATELFYRREGDGTEIQLTGIITGTHVGMNATFTDIVLLPANSYGILLFQNITAGNERFVQSGTFFSSATQVYGVANEMANRSGTNEQYLRFETNTMTLQLRARTDDNAFNGDYRFRIHYWFI